MIGRLGLLAFLVFACGSALAAPARQTQMIDVADGVRIHVVTAGAPTAKPPLVLIPGWSATAAVWDEQIDRFATDRLVVTLDPRSQGASTKTGVGDTPEQRARDLEAVLAKLELKDVVLVGWSQGAQDVAAYVGQTGAGRVKGLVLVDTAISPGAADIARHPQTAAEQFRMFAIYAAHPREYLDGMFHAIITQPRPAEAYGRLVEAAAQTPPAIGVAQLVADMFGVDRTPTLARFDRPTLVIASATSNELQAQKDQAATLAQGRFLALDKAGHAVFLDQPDRFEAALRSFIDGLS